MRKTDRAHFRVHFRERCQIPGSALVRVFVGTLWCVLQRKPKPSWAFPWTSWCTLPYAFSRALSWESSWVCFWRRDLRQTLATSKIGDQPKVFIFCPKFFCSLLGSCFRKSLMSIIFPPVIRRPGMAAPILWRLELFGTFSRKTSMLMKFLVLAGEGLLLGWGVPMLCLRARGFFWMLGERKCGRTKHRRIPTKCERD